MLRPTNDPRNLNPFYPLEDVIRNNLIQAILNQNINDVEPNTQNTNYQPEFQIIYDFFVISQSSENTRF